MEIDLKEKLWFALLTIESWMCLSVALPCEQEFKRWFDGQDVETVYPDIKSVEKSEFQDDVNEKITSMRPHLLYAVARERIGQISFIPKASGFKAHGDWVVGSLFRR